MSKERLENVESVCRDVRVNRIEYDLDEVNEDTITVYLNINEVLSEIIPTLLRKQDEVSNNLAHHLINSVYEKQRTLQNCANKYINHYTELKDEVEKWREEYE